VADEPTLLAGVRTALSLMAAGVAVIRQHADRRWQVSESLRTVGPADRVFPGQTVWCGRAGL